MSSRATRDRMGLLVLFLVLALTVSFLCSIMEATLLSITPTFVASLHNQPHGERLAHRVSRLKADVDRPLAAILTMNTVANTIGAVGVGAQVQLIFGNAYVAVASGLMTLLILVLSEIIPKTLGAVYWRKLTPVLTPILLGMMWLTYPFVILSKTITRLMASGKAVERVSREEFHALSTMGQEDGVLDESESQILRNLFLFRSVRVADVMTPRTVMFALPETLTVGDVVEHQTHLPFARIIVYDRDPDSCTGYVLRHDILHSSALDRDHVKLEDLKRSILVVPESLSLQRLFERLLERKEQIALVIDEYGGTAGLVTMEDVVETLLGTEIVDEVDTVQDMQELARQRWRKRAERLGLMPAGGPGES